jgi:PBSX family phage terminase large subunit
MKLILEGHKVQRDFWESDSKYRGFFGGIGSGKSYAGSLEILKQPSNTIGMVVAPTYPMLRDSTQRLFFDTICPKEFIKSHNKSQNETKLINGSTILWRSSDNADRLRGSNLHWFYIDEAAYTDDPLWNILVGRLRASIQKNSNPKDYHRGWLTTTPKGMSHWTYRVFCEDQDDNFKIFQSNTKQNKYIPKDFYDNLTKQYGGKFALQELDGAFIDLSSDFIRRSDIRFVHPSEIQNKPLQWIRAWDLAASNKTSADSTASIQACLYEDILYLRSPIKYQKQWPESKQEIIATTNRERIPIGVESIASWRTATDDLKSHSDIQRWGLTELRPQGDKLSKASPWAAKLAAGQVRLVDDSHPLWDEFIKEWIGFPNLKHDDCVDAVSLAYYMLKNQSQVGSMILPKKSNLFKPQSKYF